MHKGSPRTNQNAGSGSGRGVDRRGRDHPAQARNLPPPPPVPVPVPVPDWSPAPPKLGGGRGRAPPWRHDGGRTRAGGEALSPQGKGTATHTELPPPPQFNQCPQSWGKPGGGPIPTPRGGGGGYTRHWGAPSLPSQWILGNYQLATPERLVCVLVENPRGGWGGTGGPLLSHPPPPPGGFLPQAAITPWRN